MERMAKKVTLLFFIQIINNVIVPPLSGDEPYRQFLCTLPFVSACFLTKYLMVKYEMLNTNPPPAPPPAGDIIPL
ncbi:hypothetical protein KSMBR1_0265 [Candidatus Kuenenia stuttgartiensis]|uniref:Uncharacterized protein n=1 Tax=Kuenenia stuttgartiensis TaxID=174633 RepID=A0A2C9CAR6_KUEST|nr:hypothetical protein KSMBR1_0265 [Candidatus Kuenenia stuttgartiensis]